MESNRNVSHPRTGRRRFFALILVMGGLLFTGWAAFGTSSERSDNNLLPGAAPFDTAMVEAFERMKKMRGKKYVPRTKHTRPDGSAKYTNRLFLETSPYLLQHAHNPVNWYPWGDEAFDAAARLNRPVLLSVGYSTCHWCHVMEEESFEDEEIARFLNKHYIAVKVDREERPDVDAVYMSAVQALTGRGGWPMTVWLIPDRKPFYGGTYFPARDGDRGAPAGFLTLLNKVQEVYHAQPDRIGKAGNQVTTVIRERLKPVTGDRLPEADLLHSAIDIYRKSFDATYGGMTGAPKFPSSLPVRLLLRYHRRTEEPRVLEMAQTTLEKMASGGIYDQAGGGFHRYSTDEKWLVPHFEKMLYDNALLVMAYLDGYQVTGDASFKKIVKEVLEYIHRDMTSPEGAFYSATDADSLTPAGELEEGYYFTWTKDELVEVLGVKRAEWAAKQFGMKGPPNFEGRFILHLPESKSGDTAPVDQSIPEWKANLATVKELLVRHRNLRPRPLRDDKILTAWNGLMISAHARAGMVLDDPLYAERAVRAAHVILTKLSRDGRLYRSFKDDQAGYPGFLDDYAFFSASLLDLYEATADIRWLKKAITFDEVLKNSFEDTENGGFFMTGKSHENLIAREKPHYDGAEPSGNSVALLNLMRLYTLTLDDSYRKRYERGLAAFLGGNASNALALSEMMMALDFYLDLPKEIVIVFPEGKRADVDPFLAEIRKHFLPHRILVVAEEGEDLKRHAEVVPVAAGKKAIDGKVTAYVCEKNVCKLPAVDADTFFRQLGRVEKLIRKEG